VKPHALDPAHAQRREAPFVLEPAEAAFYGRTAPVEALSAQRLARDQGCSRSALIHMDVGLHSPVGQHHLVALRVGSAHG
jgi:hypothetical protein